MGFISLAKLFCLIAYLCVYGVLFLFSIYKDEMDSMGCSEHIWLIYTFQKHSRSKAWKRQAGALCLLHHFMSTYRLKE